MEENKNQDIEEIVEEETQNNNEQGEKTKIGIMERIKSPTLVMKIVIGVIIFCIVAAILGTIMVKVEAKNAGIEVINPETYTLESSYVIPGTPAIPEVPAKPAEYSDPKTYTLSAGTYIVGEDIPAGTYDISPTSAYEDNCVVWVGSDLVLNDVYGWSGATCEKKNEKLRSGQTVEIEHMSMDFTGEEELVTPAVDAIPAVPAVPDETITESATYTYNGDSDKDNLDDNYIYNEEDYKMTCTINGAEAECDTLKDQEMITEVKSMYSDEQFNEVNAWYEGKWYYTESE